MDFSIYRNAWRLYKSQFGKLTSFVFSLATIFLAVVVCYFFVSAFDFSISCILLCAFVFLPLLYSFQLIVGMVSAGREVEYGDLYKTYKVYLSPSNRGTYGIIISLFLTSLISILMIYLSLTVYDFVFPDVFEVTVTPYLKEEILTIELYEQLIEDVFNMNGYKYFFISSMAFPFLFFFSRLEKNFLTPYFGMMIPLPSRVIKSYSKEIVKANKKDINKYTMPGKLFFSLSFVLGFIIFGVLGCIFSSYLPNTTMIIIIALAGGLLSSLVFVVPLMITSCFIADSLHSDYLEVVHKNMSEGIMAADKNGLDIDEENKELIKRMLDKIKEDIKKEESNDSSSDDNNQ